MSMRPRLRGILRVALAALTVVALTSVPAAEPAAGSSSAKLGLVTAHDVAGLKPAATTAAGKLAWRALLPAAARATAAVGVLRGQRIAIVSRSALTRNAAQANAVSRTLGRLAAAELAHLDKAAVGRGRLGPGTAHAVWNAGSWVGQVSVIGAGRSGAALARAAATGVRTRITRTLNETAWDKVLDQVRPNGSVSVNTALQAFSLAIAPLPGVKVPAGRVGTIRDGTLALDWVLQRFNKLTPAQQAAVEQTLSLLHGARQPAARVLASSRGSSAKPPGWQANAAYQKIAESESAAISAKLGNVPLSLGLHVGTGGVPDATAFAVTYVVNAQGDWGTGPPADCWISVGPIGQEQTGDELKATLAHEVFHCFQGQFAGLPQDASTPKWVAEGGAEWVACTLVPNSVSSTFWAKYLGSPADELFGRDYDAMGFFQLLAQHGVDLWSRWPAIVKAATDNLPAYKAAVGPQEDEILWDWAASYAQDPARGPDWDPSGPCKPPRKQIARIPSVIEAGATSSLSLPEWNVELDAPFSSADVIRVTVQTGHVRLTSPGLDVKIDGTADFCTADTPCTCPDASSSDLKNIAANGDAYFALTGGPTGVKASVTGLTLEDYCKTKGKPSGTCSGLAKQVPSILGLSNSVVLDTPVYSSPANPGKNFGCEIGAWTGSKPTSAAQILQKARSGTAAQVAWEAWVPGSGPNASQWPDEYQQLTQAFSQGTFPNLSAPGTATRFSPPSFGYASAGITTKLGPPYVGLDFAGACWWDDATLSAKCLGDWEAVGKPVVEHLKKLAAVAIPNTLG